VGVALRELGRQEDERTVGVEEEDSGWPCGDGGEGGGA